MARRSRVHLQRRDLAILELLVERRVETLDYLQSRFWPHATRKTTANRLDVLVRHGFLDRIVRTPDDQPVLPQGGRPTLERLYILGPRAPRALGIRGLAAEHLRGTHSPVGIRAGAIDHQLATNRVGDWLAAQLMPEHLLTGPVDPRKRRHRPDAVYLARTPDEQGRSLVFVEVDLGHYSRTRVLAKIQTFLEHPDARSIVFATPTQERASTIARWIRHAYGDSVMARVQPFTFTELRDGARLDAGTEPSQAPRSVLTGAADWSDLLDEAA